MARLSEKEHQRQRDKDRKSRMSNSQLEAQRERNRQYQRDRKSRMSESQLEAERERNRQRQRYRRAQLSKSQLQANKDCQQEYYMESREGMAKPQLEVENQAIPEWIPQIDFNQPTNPFYTFFVGEGIRHKDTHPHNLFAGEGKSNRQYQKEANTEINFNQPFDDDPICAGMMGEEIIQMDGTHLQNTIDVEFTAKGNFRRQQQKENNADVIFNHPICDDPIFADMMGEEIPQLDATHLLNLIDAELTAKKKFLRQRQNEKINFNQPIDVDPICASMMGEEIIQMDGTHLRNIMEVESATKRKFRRQQQKKNNADVNFNHPIYDDPIFAGAMGEEIPQMDGTHLLNLIDAELTAKKKFLQQRQKEQSTTVIFNQQTDDSNVNAHHNTIRCGDELSNRNCEDFTLVNLPEDVRHHNSNESTTQINDYSDEVELFTHDYDPSTSRIPFEYNEQSYDEIEEQNNLEDGHFVQECQEMKGMILDIGLQEVECPHCHALMWIGERSFRSSKRSPIFGICCRGGIIKLPFLPAAPELLEDLTKGKFDDCHSKFLNLIRSYNSMFSFTSMGGKIDLRVRDGRGPYTFKISGANYHRIGTLLPSEGYQPKFAQLYIHDANLELDSRINALGQRETTGIKKVVVEEIKKMLDEVNPYVKVFRNARNLLHPLQSNPNPPNADVNVRIRIVNNRCTDGRQYILPSNSNEVAALMVGDGTEHVECRDIIVSKKNGGLLRISETHPAYMPLQYPLLFPYGEEGWRIGIPFKDGKKRGRQNKVSIREFYSFRIQFRHCEQSILLRSGRLFQQYVVDAYAAVEQERLNFIRLNQKVIREEMLNGLQDAVTNGETNPEAVGKRLVLPSSFHGGPRDMYQNYQDAIAICRWAGPPTFFITFTCNPKWKEITQAISKIPHQKPEDRPDIVARIFNLKLKELMKDLKERKIFGRSIADIYVIEFQKRGLPHAHILITIAEEDKPRTAEDIDRFVQAEIPDKLKHPRAHAIVLRTMIHGPCGNGNLQSPCMDNGVCSKRYPRKFNSETTVDKHGYVQYRRRDDGQRYNKNEQNIVDNRWVVPYNIDLVTKYDAHINVEICAHPKLLKYLYKYIHKGHDRSTIVIEDNSAPAGIGGQPQYKEIDEVKLYLDCRYVSSIEACWRIFEFTLHSQHPAVERLPFHLPNQQNIIFNETESLEDVVARPGVRVTKLTEWFVANQNFEKARQLTYTEFPEYWVWNSSRKVWTERKQRVCIGRMYFAHPTSGERFYLRMLLCIVRGAKCYEDLRTVDGKVCRDFKSACVALGLLEDDNEWHQALTEASSWSSGHQLRIFFASILMFCEPTNPVDLWEKHWKCITDDFLHIAHRETSDYSFEFSEHQLMNMGLFEIEDILNQNGRSLKEFPTMPMPVSVDMNIIKNKLILEELSYSASDSLIEFEQLHNLLNEEQNEVMVALLESYRSGKGGVHFIYGSGGTGKTFLWKVLIAKFRSEKKIVLSVASSGIAALLLPGGRTAHSRFKIPLQLHDSSTCSINQQSQLSELIQKADLIIWDEAPMLTRNAFEAVDRTFRDLMKFKNDAASTTLFGGKTVVLGGDFRQILPVIPKGGRESIVSSSLQRSYIWRKCHVHYLKVNMRLMRIVDNVHRAEQEDFGRWILNIGEGKIPGISMKFGAEPDWIEIPKDLLIKGLEKLVNFTYPNITNNYSECSYLEQRAILAPKNEDVDKINSYILSLIPGKAERYLSADSAEQTSDGSNEVNLNPPELLNSIKCSGLPNHCLELKEGVPIMLLRNLNQTLGMCNGTRLIIQKLGKKVIQAKIITGRHVGEIVLISRMSMSPSQIEWPFVLRRTQFPVKLAFAMTINKSQGQTLQHVGLYLRNPVFCHGQLYVALSRCTTRNGLRILLAGDSDEEITHTRNVVYREVIDGMYHSNVDH